VGYLSQYSVWLQTVWPEFDSRQGKGFFSSLYVQTNSDAYAASCPMGPRGSFPRGKAQLEHDTDHLPPTTAKVKNK
jgi:hypothetical protein